MFSFWGACIPSLFNWFPWRPSVVGPSDRRVCCDWLLLSAMCSNGDNDWPVHSLMFYFHNWRGLPLQRLPPTVTCSTIFGCVSCRQTWPNDDNLRHICVTCHVVLFSLVCRMPRFCTRTAISDELSSNLISVEIKPSTWSSLRSCPTFWTRRSFSSTTPSSAERRCSRSSLYFDDPAPKRWSPTTSEMTRLHISCLWDQLKGIYRQILANSLCFLY